MQSMLMRSAAASALALILAAAASAQDPSGFIGAGISTTEIDAGGADDDVTGYDVGGVYFNDLGGLNLQFSAGYDYLDTDPNEVDGVAAELNLFGRTDGHALGVFADVIDSEDNTTMGVGGEGQIFRDAWTWGASAAWFDGDDAYDNAIGACGFGRLYGSDNFAIEGRAGIANVDYGAGDTNAYSFGAGAEYQFMGTPFSLTGDVDHASLDDTDVDATGFRLGGKIHFGTSDLVSRDRNGAGMRGASCVSGAAAL